MSAVEINDDPDTHADHGAEPDGSGAEQDTPLAANPTANTSRLGHTIDLRQNRFATLLTALLASVVVVVFASLWIGQFAKTETARGVVSATGGFSRLDAPRAGIIKEVYVNQGETVQAGKPIYLLRFGEAGSGGETAVANDIRTSMQTRANLVIESERARNLIALTREQQTTLRSDQTALIAAVDNQEKSIQGALAQSRQNVDRIRKLVQQGLATRDLLDQHERTFFEYERQLTEVRLKRVEYRRQDAEKQRELSNLLADKENQRASAENQINSIDSQLGRLRTESALEIQAQSSGQVLAMTGKVGDSVDAGQFVAAIGDPNADPLIVLDAPARATGLIKIGQQVILKYDAFPFKTFGIHHGTVTGISSAAIRAPSQQGDAGLEPKLVERQSLYRVEVKPDSNDIEAYGEKVRLKIGSTLSADIVVERRRLIDWVLDPIRAMRGRI